MGCCRSIGYMWMQPDNHRNKTVNKELTILLLKRYSPCFDLTRFTFRLLLLIHTRLPTNHIRTENRSRLIISACKLITAFGRVTLGSNERSVHSDVSRKLSPSKPTEVCRVKITMNMFKKFWNSVEGPTWFSLNFSCLSTLTWKSVEYQHLSVGLLCAGLLAFTQQCVLPFFDVLLTVHLSIILVINQLNAQILVL